MGFNNSKQKSMNLKNRKRNFTLYFFKQLCRLKQGNFEMLCYSGIKHTIEIRMCYICIKIKLFWKVILQDQVFIWCGEKAVFWKSTGGSKFININKWKHHYRLKIWSSTWIWMVFVVTICGWCLGKVFYELEACMFLYTDCSRKLHSWIFLKFAVLQVL